MSASLKAAIKSGDAADAALGGKCSFSCLLLLVLSDLLPGNKDGNSWISYGNIRTEVLIQEGKEDGGRTLCSLVASKELTLTTSVLFNYLIAIMKML